MTQNSNIVYIVLGESNTVPGRVTRVCATQAIADTNAAELLNILLEEVEMEKDATADNWGERLAAMRVKRAADLEIDEGFITDDDCGAVWVETSDLLGATNNRKLVSDLWGKIEDGAGDFFDLRERVRGAVWNGETETPVAAGIKPLVFEKANMVGGLEFLRATAANGDYAIICFSDAFELRLSGIAIGGKNFDTVDDAKIAAGEHYAEYMKRFVNLATTRVAEMRLSDGRTDYYVEVTCEGRSLTPHVFKIKGRAEYEVACWNWLLSGGDKPDLLAFDTDGPAMPDLGTVELMKPDEPALIDQGEFVNYRAVVTATTSYTLDFAAGDLEEARGAALEIFNQSSNPDEDFGVLSSDNIVESVQPI